MLLDQDYCLNQELPTSLIAERFQFLFEY